MNRFRPWLSVVLGLVLLVQGFAVAAAEYRVPEENPMAAEQALPCLETADEGTSSCCDSGCPDMTTCALGHLAFAPTSLPALLPVGNSPRTEPVLPRSDSPPPVFLRPPIVSRA